MCSELDGANSVFHSHCQSHANINGQNYMISIFPFQSDDEDSGSEATEISERSQHFIAHVPVPSQKEVSTLGPTDIENSGHTLFLNSL